jgi:hypothetical protein
MKIKNQTNFELLDSSLLLKIMKWRQKNLRTLHGPHVQAEDGMHVVQDAFLEHMVRTGVALLGRLEDELYRALRRMIIKRANFYNPGNDLHNLLEQFVDFCNFLRQTVHDT